MTATAQSAMDPLVLVHGWGMHSSIWAGLPPSFGAGRRIHCVDLPGHSETGYRQTPATLDGWASECLARAPRRAVWIGWSLGGLVSIAAALLQPERVAALVLMCSTPRFVCSGDWTAGLDPQILDRFHENLLVAPKKTLDQFLGLQVRGSDAARETLRVLRRDLAARPLPAAAALAEGLDLLKGEDLRDRLQWLGCRSLWIFGSKDTLVSASAAAGVARLLPGARTHIVDGAGHAPFLSHPAATLTQLERFLTEIPS